MNDKIDGEKVLPSGRKPPIKSRKINGFRKSSFSNKHSNNPGKKSQWILKLVGENDMGNEIFTSFHSTSL